MHLFNAIHEQDGGEKTGEEDGGEKTGTDEKQDENEKNSLERFKRNKVILLHVQDGGEKTDSDGKKDDDNDGEKTTSLSMVCNK